MGEIKVKGTSTVTQKLSDGLSKSESAEAKRLSIPDVKDIKAKINPATMDRGEASKEIQSQVAEFDDAMRGIEPESEPEVEEIEDIEESEKVEEEEPEEVEDETVEGQEDAEAEEEEPEEGEPEEGEEEPETDNLESIRAWMVEQANLALQAQQVQPAQPAEPDQPAPLAKSFTVSEEDYEEALRSPEKFVEIINSAVNAGMDKAKTEFVKYSQQTNYVKETTEAFYKDNPDLLPYDSVVSLAALNVGKAHPDWDLVKVLTETESVVRKNLKLKRESKAPSNGKTKIKPLKVRKPKSVRSKVREQLTEQQRHMYELL